MKISDAIGERQSGATDREFVAKFAHLLVLLRDLRDVRPPTTRLLAHSDVSVRVFLLRGLTEALVQLKLFSESEAVALLYAIAGTDQRLREPVIVYAERLLAAGNMTGAANAAREALSRQSPCPTAQNLLLDSVHAGHPKDLQAAAPDIFTADLRERFCRRPFEVLNSAQSQQFDGSVEHGATYVCDCGGWLPYSTGNIMTAESVDDVWNSSAAREIRRSIIDGDFSYCSRMLCPFIVGNNLPKRADIREAKLRSIIATRTTRLDYLPKDVQISHDSSCNIACSSCRNGIIMAGNREKELFAKAKERVLLPMLQKMGGTCMITGYGDPLASQHYRSILAELDPAAAPGLKLAIVTNGLLMTEHEWESPPGLRKEQCLTVSIDARSRETYEVVRRPGKWDVLRKNLDFLANLRREGELTRLHSRRMRPAEYGRCRRDRVNRSVRGSFHLLQTALRPGHSSSRPQATGEHQRDAQSDRRVDSGSGDGCLSLGRSGTSLDSRP